MTEEPETHLELHVFRYSSRTGEVQERPDPGPIGDGWFWQWAMDRAAAASRDCGLPVSIHYLFGTAVGGIVPPPK